MNLQSVNQPRYNLEERTAVFAGNVIKLVKQLPPTSINSRIIEQLVGSSGSIAANYCEAVEGESKKDFTHKIGIAKKEIKETKLWLRLLAQAHPEQTAELRKLWQEAQELLLIFSKIVSSSRKTK